MSDVAMMRRALTLAEVGWGRVHPNPMVGAVIVGDGVVVGEGAHREFGGHHAEIEALRAAGERARGATLYVTLEPCSHHGKTPPCTEAVVEAGIRRVVFATEDPDAAAAGGGTVLTAAGLEVIAGVERDAARRQNALFLTPAERGRPFVALKYGLSLDGRIARVEGEQTQVTGPAAQAEVHRLRAGYQALLVGGRTARTDDPQLTARGAVEPRVPPVRVVVSASADLPLESRLVATARQTPVWVVAAADAPAEAVAALEEHGVHVLQVGSTGSERVLDPVAVIDGLAGAGIRTILCEGGGRLGAALVAARLVDRMYLFHAPVLFGTDGVPAFPAAALSFEGSVVEVRRVGADTLTIVERSG